ncbi:MAG: DUF3868 domain-containing protein [Rikenellaceae bacterium]
MKRYCIILVALFAAQSIASAQNKLGAELNIQEFEYQADSVKINIEFNLETLEIGANESVVFTPKMFKKEDKLELPTLVIRRRGGARSYNRAVTLENAKSIESYNDWYGTPYQIIEYYGSDKQERVQYNLTIPYQKWMVDAQLYVDCITCGCCVTEDNGVLIPDNNYLLIDVPYVEAYQVTPIVELIKPEKVAIKRRDIAYSSALVFKVNSTYIDSNLESNRVELESIDEMMQSVMLDSDYTITKVNIIGYASPEGSLESNMILSKGRAAALEKLMERKYKSIKPELYSVRYGGENWGKLYELVSESDIADRDTVLDIIKNTTVEEGRELKLVEYNGGETYKYLLQHLFPATRLVVVDVEYNVDAYDLERIGELIDIKPQNLSLEEMYRLSETFDMDDAEFEKIFLTAAEIYPNDEVAQNNALVTEIRRGNIETIKSVAGLVDQQTTSAELANSYGVYCLLTGDYQMAEIMLNRALKLGCERAESNIEQLNKKLENIVLLEENKVLRMKIYGEK